MTKQEQIEVLKKFSKAAIRVCEALRALSIAVINVELVFKKARNKDK